MENDVRQAETGERSASALTSTLGTINTTPTTADAMPSSSSDANTGEANEGTAESKPMEETISSTSDEVDRFATEIDATSATLTADNMDKMDIDKEADMFANDFNLSTTSTVKITENVEDIVSDLENLLGNPVDDYKIKPDALKKEAKTTVGKKDGDSELHLENIPHVPSKSSLNNEIVKLVESESGNLEVDTCKDKEDKSTEILEKDDSLKMDTSDKQEVHKTLATNVIVTYIETTVESTVTQEQGCTSDEIQEVPIINEIKEDAISVESIDDQKSTLEVCKMPQNETPLSTENTEKVDSELKVQESKEMEDIVIEQPMESTNSKESEEIAIDYTTESTKAKETKVVIDQPMEPTTIKETEEMVIDPPIEATKAKETEEMVIDQPIELTKVKEREEMFVDQPTELTNIKESEEMVDQPVESTKVNEREEIFIDQPSESTKVKEIVDQPIESTKVNEGEELFIDQPKESTNVKESEMNDQSIESTKVNKREEIIIDHPTETTKVEESEEMIDQPIESTKIKGREEMAIYQPIELSKDKETNEMIIDQSTESRKTQSETNETSNTPFSEIETPPSSELTEKEDTIHHTSIETPTIESKTELVLPIAVPTSMNTNATDDNQDEPKVSENIPKLKETAKTLDKPIPSEVIADLTSSTCENVEKQKQSAFKETESLQTVENPIETENIKVLDKQCDELPMVIDDSPDQDPQDEIVSKDSKEIVENEAECQETEKMDEPEIDHEAELVRAAIEASSFRQYPKEDDKPQEVPPPAVSDDDVIRAAMDCTARDCNDEEDLIKAAQECQEREIHEVVQDGVTAETRRVELQVSSTTTSFAEDTIPLVIVEDVEEDVKQEEPKDVENILVSNAEEQEEDNTEDNADTSVQDYQKPLNIVVDSSVKDTVESSTLQEDSNKESSDEDKDKDKQEYSSKISQSQELKLTIRKTKAEETSILKIFDPMDEVIEISPSESETDQEPETPIPKLVIKQSQVSPKRKVDLSSPFKITIKPIPAKQEDSITERCAQKSSPKLIIKPIVKPDDELHHSPKITIKPIPKPDELERCNSPKITIKPLIKPEACISPKIKIKPIVKPDEEMHTSSHSFEEERIVLKISKRDATPKRDSTPKRESSRCATPKLEEKDEKEKLGKIKMKFSMSGGGHAHIVNEHDSETGEIEAKRSKLTPDTSYNDSMVSLESSFITSPDVTAEKPITPTPKRRGRPRKVPLQVRVEDEEPVVVVESAIDLDESSVSAVGDGEEEPVKRPPGRPKRSCRGPSNVRDTLGLKPLGERGRGGRGSRRPRGRGTGRGRGRGGRGRGRGAKAAEAFEREELAESNLKLKEAAIDVSFDDVEDVEMKGEDAPQEDQASIEQDGDSDVMIYEEDTRMSADDLPNTSPAKQVVNPIVGELIEESQSSVLSTGTTESAKLKKSKMEIEPEGAVISADQLAEYYWGGGGPYMLQEQVAQYLGIKSFKRKYPGIPRRQVDMQERDFIRESGLASEHMCDLGLTVVNSADILDLMYSDFQHKYEEYCKLQRDRQSKDITNKQKALSLAASQEKNKMDIMQQAVESAAQWNASFNKQRREDRKACMDLQTFTINYPKGRMKKLDRAKIGHYPLALVPGQYTDYYKNYTPTELNNLPLNTMLYNPINIPEDESQSSGSESDTSSSSSESSDSESSEDDCNMCSSPPPAATNRRVYS